MSRRPRKISDVKQYFISLLRRLSFKTGVIVLCLCVPFYILAFLPMLFSISYSLKGVLWVLFFGLAKTAQYTGLFIIGAEGIKRLKTWFAGVRSNLRLLK